MQVRARRARPAMDSDYERIRSAIGFLRDRARRQPRLATVAAHVGLSPAHFQRVFRRWAGVSPKRFLQFLSAAEAKRLLRESRTVLDTAFAVGLSGPGRLHDLLLSTEAVTPGEYARRGAGLTLRHGLHDSPFGRCLLTTTERGVCALRFVEAAAQERALAELREEWPQARFVEDARGTARVARALFSRRQEPILLFLQGTNFQLKVWEGLLRIPEGATISYADLARRLGVPRATRAVASAVGDNPIGWLIPCHRVLRSSGALGGYRWGIERKELLLAREMARARGAGEADATRTGRGPRERSHG